MSDAGATSGVVSAEAQQLEELERVTRQYARYANVSGIPVAFVSLWILTGVLAMPGAASRAMLLTAPLIWAIAAAISPRLAFLRERLR